MTTSESSRRALLLFGTDELVEPMRHLRAGALTADFDRGNLRYIRWGGFEVLRAVAFVIRDTGWGTYTPVLSKLDISEGAEHFGVRYKASVAGTEGLFRYTAEVTGSADGVLTFNAHGESDVGFATNRTGFIVLHPLEGVVGREAAVEHASGGRSLARFPDQIDPKQPVLDIRSLRHEPSPGLVVSVRMEGDTFEMEDQRNWTDASFKTYVRPLARGFPYQIAPGEAVAQRVTMKIEGSPPKAVRGSRELKIRLGESAGPMPNVGVFVPEDEAARARQFAGRLRALTPSYIVGRVDGRGDLECLGTIAEMASSVGAPLEVDVVIAGRAPVDELAPITDAMTRHGLQPQAVFVVPARDMRGRPMNSVPLGEVGAAGILSAARRAFPQARIGGGMPVGFTELNRNRPPPGIDFVTHATQATVHAADDVSVMETLEALPDVIRSTRALVGPVPYRLGPATIGAPAETYFALPAANADSRRVAQAADDPRQSGLFAAAFALGYVAAAAELAVDAITLAASSGSAGLFSADGRPYPIAAVIKGLAALAGCRRISTTVSGEGRLAAIAAANKNGPVVWLANLSAAPVDAFVEASFGTIWRMNAEALAERSPLEVKPAPFGGGVVRLDAYAVCRLG